MDAIVSIFLFLFIVDEETEVQRWGRRPRPRMYDISAFGGAEMKAKFESILQMSSCEVYTIFKFSSWYKKET